MPGFDSLFDDPVSQLGFGLLIAGQPGGDTTQGINALLQMQNQSTKRKQTETELQRKAEMDALNKKKILQDLANLPTGYRMNDAGQAELISGLDPSYARKAQDGLPASLQEMAWLQDPARKQEEIDLYFANKRAPSMINLGDRYGRVNPGGPGLSEDFEMGVSPENQPGFRANVQEAEAAGKARGEAQANLPNAVQNAEYMLSTIDQMLAPEKGLAVGAGSVFGGPLGMQGRQAAMLPLGKDQRKFQPVIDQLRGQTFLRAFESLKGGGHITEIEGLKGEQAIARLNQAQDDEDAEAALRELREVVSSGLEVARQKAGVSTGDSPAPFTGQGDASASMPSIQGGAQPDAALAQKIQRAREAGYSDDEIKAYLGGGNAAP